MCSETDDFGMQNEVDHSKPLTLQATDIPSIQSVEASPQSSIQMPSTTCNVLVWEKAPPGNRVADSRTTHDMIEDSLQLLTFLDTVRRFPRAPVPGQLPTGSGVESTLSSGNHRQRGVWRHDGVSGLRSVGLTTISR